MTRIVVVGTGGVGGFLGGLLARRHEGGSEVEVCFISRGKALERIRREGLEVDTAEGVFTARPAVATDDASQTGTADYVLYCTKAYDVESGIRQIMPCIGPRTVIIPFLNGVDSYATIRRMLPQNEVWFGCVYVVAYIVEPGRIRERTNGYRYLYGSASAAPQRLRRLDEIFSAAGICARSYDDIEQRVWDKFGFISTVASVTSYTDATYGEVLATPRYRELLDRLLGEFRAVATACGAPLSPDMEEGVIAQMERIPPETTTSMQRDFRARRPTEVESLTGHIVREGRRTGTDVAAYEMVYAGLLGRL